MLERTVGKVPHVGAEFTIRRRYPWPEFFLSLQMTPGTTMPDIICRSHTVNSTFSLSRGHISLGHIVYINYQIR